MALRPATSCVIALLAIAASCPVQAATITRIDDPDMYAVYTAVLAEKPRGWKSVAVVNVTRPELGRDLLCPDLSKLTGEWAEAVTDYRDRNRQAYRLKWKFQLPRRKVSLIFQDEADRSEHTLQLSAVGFNRAKTHAVVTWTDDHGGESLKLQKVDEQWRLVHFTDSGFDCGWLY
jgi:hypothetical protein